MNIGMLGQVAGLIGTAAALVVALLLTKRRGQRGALKTVLVRTGIFAAVLLLLVGGSLLIVSKTMGGPGMFSAMRAAQSYLAARDGSSPNGWHVSVTEHIRTSGEPQEGCYIIGYEGAGRSGTLRASYSDSRANEKFQFEEIVTTNGAAADSQNGR